LNFKRESIILMFGSFLPGLGWLAPLKSTRAWEPTLLWNQLRCAGMDFAGGEAEFKKSFELDPNDGTARQWYADDIAMIGGREQEAVAEVNRAHELDPLSLVITRVVGSVHVWKRQFDEALAVCRHRGPHFWIPGDDSSRVRQP